jgi:predicted DNA-binding transcriptional regulator YafY
MNRVDRLMGVLTVLQSHKFAAEIVGKFEISVRTDIK